jgi:hypothetical protein
MGAFGVLLAYVIKHSAAFGGGGLVSYALDLGFTGTPSAFVTFFNVFTAPADTALQDSTTVGLLPTAATWDVTATATVGGANLDQATTGSVDIWLLVATLP